MSDNMIIIEPIEAGGDAVMFRAPADNQAARQLWFFLVENLQSGFVVELSSFGGAAELTRPSGAKLSQELYEAVMDGKGGER
jgi:hypothetical protein